MAREPTTPEEAEALAVLAKHGRVLAILVPEGIPDEAIRDLSSQVNRALDELAAERDARRRAADA